jgi:MFS family permease
MVAPGIGYCSAELGNTSTLLESFAVSIFVLGYSVGSLVLAPLSEIYGRKPVSMPIFL